MYRNNKIIYILIYNNGLLITELCCEPSSTLA